MQSDLKYLSAHSQWVTFLVLALGSCSAAVLFLSSDNTGIKSKMLFYNPNIFFYYQLPTTNYQLREIRQLPY
ncbi:hypothetical protein SAMN05216556_10514 [Aequorivita viscosa]|nr:hypothetical protein SAMN05216556_10514 [Aequorivita viscosa]